MSDSAPRRRYRGPIAPNDVTLMICRYCESEVCTVDTRGHLAGEVIKQDMVTFADGHRATHGELVRCPTCAELVYLS